MPSHLARRTALAAALAAVAVIAASPPAAAVRSTAVACVSRAALWTWLDDAERRAVPLVPGGPCRALDHLATEVVSVENGIARIRIFPRPGDRGSGEIAYTLEEMLGPSAAE